MKKLILGLVMSVGMSGMAMASNDVKIDKLQSVEKVADCTINTLVTVRDSEGILISSSEVITTGTGAECNGAQNGVVYGIYMVRLRGASIQP
ncbi:hypothetical protein [Frigoriflavimonas asaccharolytica]|uniref:Uncharacterized protein n=1 Tax=Frigoriflavimonas asaccharolytica TaxID=2735899 RepID=A0A8J8KBL6_9FLAO|nr:hypothetical protein [Frigoriflavimonas asaccharolytica]NRS92704.1 hypothetical protein [Frigoriflavimonas asaccharolytica]